MAVVKVRDLAYARLRSPDLDAQEEFLTAFGMVRAARTPTALYMRGTDAAHHIHVTEKGDPRFTGFAWTVGAIRSRSCKASKPCSRPRLCASRSTPVLSR